MRLSVSLTLQLLRCALVSRWKVLVWKARERERERDEFIQGLKIFAAIPYLLYLILKRENKHINVFFNVQLRRPNEIIIF